jgi:hypothetical protein
VQFTNQLTNFGPFCIHSDFCLTHQQRNTAVYAIQSSSRNWENKFWHVLYNAACLYIRNVTVGIVYWRMLLTCSVFSLLPKRDVSYHKQMHPFNVSVITDCSNLNKSGSRHNMARFTVAYWCTLISCRLKAYNFVTCSNNVPSEDKFQAVGYVTET